MNNRTAAACAACSSKPDVTARALASFDDWAALQPVGAFREARRNNREFKRMRNDAVDLAVKNEKRANPPKSVIGWFALQFAAAAIRVVLMKLFDWWWRERGNPPSDDRAD